MINPKCVTENQVIEKKYVTNVFVRTDSIMQDIIVDFYFLVVFKTYHFISISKLIKKLKRAKKAETSAIENLVVLFLTRRTTFCRINLISSL